MLEGGLEPIQNTPPNPHQQKLKRFVMASANLYMVIIGNIVTCRDYPEREYADYWYVSGSGRLDDIVHTYEMENRRVMCNVSCTND